MYDNLWASSDVAGSSLLSSKFHVIDVEEIRNSWQVHTLGIINLNNCFLSFCALQLVLPFLLQKWKTQLQNNWMISMLLTLKNSSSCLKTTKPSMMSLSQLS